MAVSKSVEEMHEGNLSYRRAPEGGVSYKEIKPKASLSVYGKTLGNSSENERLKFKGLNGHTDSCCVYSSGTRVASQHTEDRVAGFSSNLVFLTRCALNV